MKAAVLTAPYQLRVQEVPKPQVKPGHVLVNVKATAICGTDVAIYKGKPPLPGPRILGHESTGEVVEVGAGVTDLKVGDRVVLNSVIFCRHCEYCFQGQVTLCPNGGLMGREVEGTFAEYVAVPDFNAIKIPDHISYEDGTSFIALATVFRSHTKVKIVPGESVAVLGLGPAGLMQARVSVLAGASPVFAITRSQWKLDIAQGYGAVPVSAKDNDPVAAVKAATNGQGADLVIESVGSGATLRQAMEMVKPGGTVLCFGIYPSSVNDFFGYAMYFKDLKLVGSRGMAPRDFELGIKCAATGAIDLKPMITHRYNLDSVVQALEMVDKSPGDVLRAVVKI